MASHCCRPVSTTVQGFEPCACSSGDPRGDISVTKKQKSIKLVLRHWIVSRE